MKRWNARHQNLLQFCPESEYYHKKRISDLQHSTKLINMPLCSLFINMLKKTFLHLSLRSGAYLPLRVISRQLIQKISKMQPTLSEFYEIWYACRTFLPDSKYTIFLKIGQVEPKLWVLATFCVHWSGKFIKNLVVWLHRSITWLILTFRPCGLDIL